MFTHSWETFSDIPKDLFKISFFGWGALQGQEGNFLGSKKEKKSLPRMVRLSKINCRGESVWENGVTLVKDRISLTIRLSATIKSQWENNGVILVKDQVSLFRSSNNFGENFANKSDLRFWILMSKVPFFAPENGIFSYFWSKNGNQNFPILP